MLPHTVYAPGPNLEPLDTSASQEEKDLARWQTLIEERLTERMLHDEDPSHDLGHIRRVALWAQRFAREEHTRTGEVAPDPRSILAAGLLHDLVNLPKNDPLRAEASHLAAQASMDLLRSINFPEELLEEVFHAIHAHSFSAEVEPRTLLARCIQDADRLEALGALGAMRTFCVSGRLCTSVMHPTDPAAKQRPLCDKAYALDHFELKILRLADTLHTQAAKAEGEHRSDVLRRFKDLMVAARGKAREESAVLEIAHSCWEAGREGKNLFSPIDPLARERGREPERFVVDDLLKRLDPSDPFTIEFLKALARELSEESVKD